MTIANAADNATYHMTRGLGPLGLRHVFAVGVSVALIIFASFIIKILMSVVLLEYIVMRVINGGSVKLRKTDLRVRSWNWATIPYDNVMSVESYTPAATRRSYFIAKAVVPSVRIELKHPQWIFVLTPIPLLLRKRTQLLALDEADSTRFIGELNATIRMTARS